jgi:PadR family transcriptional regulator PadR
MRNRHAAREDSEPEADTRVDHRTTVTEPGREIHVLYHASKKAIYGVGVAAELEKHGYRLSPGTLYPLLHNLQAAEFLDREDRTVGGKVRKYYRITPLGQRALEDAREKVVSLVDEVTEKPARRTTRQATKRRRG